MRQLARALTAPIAALALAPTGAEARGFSGSGFHGGFRGDGFGGFRGGYGRGYGGYRLGLLTGSARRSSRASPSRRRSWRQSFSTPMAGSASRSIPPGLGGFSVAC